MAWFKILAFCGLFSLFPGEAFATIGKVIGVQQGAELTSGGKTRRISAGMNVATGDTISTDSKGLVQIVFNDETKIAVGPNARMVLDVTMLRGGKKAKSFAVQTLGGSFRFISGKSKKSAYVVKTPTSTMGVRGTVFDLWVVGDKQSSLVMLEGVVRMCGLSGRCKSIRGQCSIVATNAQGRVGRPIDKRQAARALNAGFPFITSQNTLLQPFRVDISGCASITDPPNAAEVVDRASQPDSVSTPAPAPAPPGENSPAAGEPAGQGGNQSSGGNQGTGGGNGGGQGSVGGSGGTGVGSGGGEIGGAGGVSGGSGGGSTGGSGAPGNSSGGNTGGGGNGGVGGANGGSGGGTGGGTGGGAGGASAASG